MEVRWAPEAADDLERIAIRIRQDNPRAARRIADTIYRRCADLRLFPNRQYVIPMKRDRVITLLKQHETEFRDAGIGALFLFGSVARDQAHGASDIDVFFDLARPQGFTLFDLVALQERMQEILGAKVDLMTRNGIHPRRRPRIEAAAVQVF